jgi:hypothetical protein
MIDYPYLKEQPSTRQTVSVFRGLNRNTRIGQGEFSEMENMTSDHYPVLSPRGKRGRVGQAEKPEGMYYVPGKGTFYIDNGRLHFIDEDGRIFTESNEEGSFRKNTHHRFALMGKSLIVAPDMRWVDIDDHTVSYPMGAKWEVTAGNVTISLCQGDGEDYAVGTIGEEAPSDPKNLDLWMDMGASPNTLRQYSSYSGEWISIPTTYLKISGLSGHPFSAGDAVTITGIESHDSPRGIGAMEGARLVEAVGSDYLIITGITDAVYTQDCGVHPLEIAREVPELDFVLEAGNRLWGCKRDANEIYASKLGDFKNWNVFSGLSTDSWVGNVGSAGWFTGAVNHGGYPVFYKETVKHKVWLSSTGAHQITSIPCNGVDSTCSESIAVYEGSVLYANQKGIYLEDGSGEMKISQPLESGIYSSGSYGYGYGAVHEDKYYLSIWRSGSNRELLVYDLNRKLWHRESGSDFVGLVSARRRLYGVTKALEGGIWDLTGSRGEKEAEVDWRVRTGDLMLESPDRKYITRLTLRLELEPGSKLEIYVRYDQEKQWQKLGMTYGRKLGSFSLPVRPRRCDHLQLELRGRGMGKVYSITKTLEEGSELP